MTLLDEAHAIASGDSRQLPSLDHLHALVDEVLRLQMLNGTLMRSLQMLEQAAIEDMDARDQWADEQEAKRESQQPV